MAGVGAGYGVAEVAFDPGQGGVAEPVGADLLAGDPGQVFAEALPEMVVAAPGQWCSVAVAQQRSAVVGGAAFVGVAEQVGHECW